MTVSAVSAVGIFLQFHSNKPMNFPKHKCGLYLSHNEHKDFYETAAKWIKDKGDRVSFRDDEAIKRAVETDNIWVLQWYQNSPLGFYIVAAPTLDEVLKLALETEAEYNQL